MKFRELEKIILKDGWSLVRVAGSHYIYVHKSKPGTLIIPCHGSKDIPRGFISGILKKAGLK
jgi:predicted RNA binding protein YcfA (HicA-like mRNA interferase family)